MRIKVGDGCETKALAGKCQYLVEPCGSDFSDVDERKTVEFDIVNLL